MQPGQIGRAFLFYKPIGERMNTDGPSLAREDVIENFNSRLQKATGETIQIDELAYCSWPESFGSTCGPFPGIGGQMVTTFRMEAWAARGYAIVFCAGRVVRWCEFGIGATWRRR